MDSSNWEMSVQMFSQCVKLVPDNLTYRQLLRSCTMKKYDDNKKGAGGLAKTKLMSIRGKVKKAKKKEEWEEAAAIAEEGLLINPWDAQLNVDIAEASKALERGEIAKFAYLQAIKTATKDKDIHVALADLLEERLEFEDCQKIWERIAVIDPKDIEVSRKLSGLAALQATKKGNFEDAESASDVAQNKDFASEAKSVSAKADNAETALRHAIRKEPDKVEHYLTLAAQLKTNKKYEESYEILNKAYEISAEDPSVKEQMEDAELLLMKTNVDLAKEKADESEDPEDRKKVAALSKELRVRKIDILTDREVRHSQNMGLKLELATLVMQQQEWSRAIPLLQKSSQDPRLKTKALVLLGKCFMYDNKAALAKGQFARAVPDLDHDTSPDTYKEAHYLLARVCEETDDTEKAIHHFGEVLVVDYDYKDALARLEKLQGG